MSLSLLLTFDFTIFPQGCLSRIPISLSTSLPEVSPVEENSLPPGESMFDRFLQQISHLLTLSKAQGKNRNPKTYSQTKTRFVFFFRNNDLMVVMVWYDNWDVKQVLIDPSISADLLFWSAFQRLQLDPTTLGHFNILQLAFQENMSE